MKSTVFWDVTPCSPETSDVSEEHIASIFRVEEQAKQETNELQLADCFSWFVTLFVFRP
jgi:hypothetical protein